MNYFTPYSLANSKHEEQILSPFGVESAKNFSFGTENRLFNQFQFGG